MSNFWKKQVAQESANAVLEPGSIELPEEAVEAHMEDVQTDTAEIELLDRDAAILEDDADETDAQAELIEEDEDSSEDMSEDEVESLDVAQESIRKRWGIERRSVAQESRGSSRTRRKVAQESLKEDIKGLIDRFIQWLKEQGRKVKDRWLKFSNAGKTIQSRSKKFEGALRNLGSKKKDKIKGAFIKQLSKGGTFVGGNISELKDALAIAKDTQGAQSKLYDAVAEAVSISFDGGDHQNKNTHNKDVDYAKALNADGVFTRTDTTEFIGNMVAQVKEDQENGAKTIEFVERTGDVTDEVDTPSSSLLSSLNDFYNLLGKDLEKQLQEYRKTEKSREKLEKAMEALLKEVSKSDTESSKDGAAKSAGARAKMARKIAQGAASKASTISRIGAFIWKTLPTGINGYIVAGIGAYGK